MDFQVSSKINWYNKQVFDLLDNPKGGSGTVGAHMRKIGIQITLGAKSMVGVRTGKLRRSIGFRQSSHGRSQFVEVTASTPYALDHHEGTRPHKISARSGRLVRFNVGGRVVYAQRVDHPGTKPNPYLTVPMRRAVRGQ